jgi:hypothetical protein
MGMMKPKFEDVLDYVRIGDKDPHMEKMLQFHPDGPELLKQAKFICKMLERRAKPADDSDLAERSDEPVPDLRKFFARRESISVRDESPLAGEYFQELARQAPADESSSIDRLVEQASRSREELGTLVITVEGEQATLSFGPGKVQKDIDGIQISGIGITMFLPETLASNEPLTIRVSRSGQPRPVTGLKFIFMPDRGHFVRGATNRDGIVELPMPERSGILRIDSDPPQLLYVEIEE